jgi:MFS family permease
LAATLTGLHPRAFFVTYYVEVRGWSTADASILYTVFLGGFMFSSLIGGALGDWFDRKLGARDRIMLMQIYLAAFAVTSFVALRIDWGHGLLLYVVLFLFGLVAAIGFSGAVLPMVAAVAPSELSATAFALLFSLVQGLLSALLSLALGYIAEAIGLKSVMFWLVTAPYAINVFYWAYPRDVGAQQAKLAASPAA